MWFSLSFFLQTKWTEFVLYFFFYLCFVIIFCRFVSNLDFRVKILRDLYVRFGFYHIHSRISKREWTLRGRRHFGKFNIFYCFVFVFFMNVVVSPPPSAKFCIPKCLGCSTSWKWTNIGNPVDGQRRYQWWRKIGKVSSFIFIIVSVQFVLPIPPA